MNIRRIVVLIIFSIGLSACHKRAPETTTVMMDWVNCHLESGQELCTNLTFTKTFPFDNLPELQKDGFAKDCANRGFCNVQILVPEEDKENTFFSKIYGITWKHVERDASGIARQEMSGFY